MGITPSAGTHGGLTRRPVAAGRFYPADAGALTAAVDALLDAAGRRARPGVRGLVAPHAGYVYSGPVAASAFALAPRSARVVLLGPSHSVPVEGMAVSAADLWLTPLGEVPVGRDLRDAAVSAGASLDDRPHTSDHALEVELPFLQRACPDGLEILPVAVGVTSPGDVASLIEALERLGALAVVSTDLSHYLDDASAKRFDRSTADAVVACDPAALRQTAACGIHALRGLVEHASRQNLSIELLDLRTSGDTSGDTRSVVGYGAFAVLEDQVGVA